MAEALSVLLSRVLGRLASELEERPWPSLAVWSNVVRCVREERSERDLPGAARISKRLAVAAVTGSARRGWITARPGDRGRTIALTAAGHAADQHWQRRLADLDRQWLGSDLRAALEALVAQLPVELAHFPASYGVADPSAIGGSFVPAKPGLDLPPHGQDWQWVLRDRGADTVSGVHLTCLLSQALLAFAIDYEALPKWPLSSTVLVVRHLTSEPRSLSEVPGDHGISGNGKSLLERHRVAVVTSDPANPRRKLVQLTPRGREIRRSHEPALAEVERRWRERYGARVLAGLRRALEAQEAASDSTLPDHVVAPLHLG